MSNKAEAGTNHQDRLIALVENLETTVESLRKTNDGLLAQNRNLQAHSSEIALERDTMKRELGELYATWRLDGLRNDTHVSELKEKEFNAVRRLEAAQEEAKQDASNYQYAIKSLKDQLTEATDANASTAYRLRTYQYNNEAGPETNIFQSYFDSHLQYLAERIRTAIVVAVADKIAPRQKIASSTLLDVSDLYDSLDFSLRKYSLSLQCVLASFDCSPTVLDYDKALDFVHSSLTNISMQYTRSREEEGRSVYSHEYICLTQLLVQAEQYKNHPRVDQVLSACGVNPSSPDITDLFDHVMETLYEQSVDAFEAMKLSANIES